MNVAKELSYTTPLSNSTLLPLLLLSIARQKHSPFTATSIKNEYDYIIVGAGSAGSVVTARLSEIPSVNVLLLEAGHEPPILTEVPCLGGSFLGTDVDWKFKTVPQKYTGRGLINRQIGWPAGKMLGGSGNFNGLMYVRGNRKNFDDWAEQGAEGWSYSEVLPYFLKLEDNTEIEFLLNGYHAVGGPMTFETQRYHPELKGAIYEAASELGYKFVDSNAATQTGFCDFQNFIRDNQRCSSLKAYLVPAENRPNLDIVANAFVTKVLIQDGQATGVQFDYGGDHYEVEAKKEVIISAGVVNTPKILMLSGIGPKEELQKFNITVISDLPVGKNFHDHGGTSVFFTVNPRIRPFTERIADPANILQYINTRSGPLASSGNVITAFLKDLEVYPVVDFPTFQLHFGEARVSGIKGSGIKPEVYNQLVRPYENETVYSCQVEQVQPRSRGAVTMNSTNPYDPPVIDPNYLQDPRDIKSLVEGLKLCRKLIKSVPFRNLGAKEFKTLLPGCEMFANNEDKYFRCQVQSILTTLMHAVGTAKMGDPADVTTVVDPELRVKNIRGLRVVDGSIMPQVVSGNTFVPIVMIAEKASDMIKQSMNDNYSNSSFE